MPKPTLVVDLDDTLIQCAQLYNAERTAMATRAAQRTHLATEYIERLAMHIEGETFRYTEFAIDHFPRALAAASATADILAGQTIDKEAVADALSSGYHLLLHGKHGFFPGVPEVLDDWKACGWELVLYTLGDPTVQTRKVISNEITRWFAWSNIKVVKKKDQQVLTELLIQYDVDIDRSWMVGDSLSHEIKPAQAVGLKTAWVDNSAWKNFQQLFPEATAGVKPTIMGATLQDIWRQLPPLGSDRDDEENKTKRKEA
jgi:putative hydrolase of the HAD superfamily